MIVFSNCQSWLNELQLTHTLIGHRIFRCRTSDDRISCWKRNQFHCSAFTGFKYYGKGELFKCDDNNQSIRKYWVKFSHSCAMKFIVWTMTKLTFQHKYIDPNKWRTNAIQTINNKCSVIIGNRWAQRICVENSKGFGISTASTIVYRIKRPFAKKDEFHLKFEMVFTINIRSRRILCGSIWWRQRCEKVYIYQSNNNNNCWFFSMFVMSIICIKSIIITCVGFWRQQYFGRVVHVEHFHALMNRIFVLHSEYRCSVIAFISVSLIQ